MGELNRTYLLRTKVALLCRERGTVQRVRDYFPRGDAELDCQHRRYAGLIEPPDGVELLELDEDGGEDVESASDAGGDAGTAEEYEECEERDEEPKEI